NALPNPSHDLISVSRRMARVDGNALLPGAARRFRFGGSRVAQPAIPVRGVVLVSRGPRALHRVDPGRGAGDGRPLYVRSHPRSPDGRRMGFGWAPGNVATQAAVVGRGCHAGNRGLLCLLWFPTELLAGQRETL